MTGMLKPMSGINMAGAATWAVQAADDLRALDGEESDSAAWAYSLAAHWFEAANRCHSVANAGAVKDARAAARRAAGGKARRFNQCPRSVPEAIACLEVASRLEAMAARLEERRDSRALMMAREVWLQIEAFCYHAWTALLVHGADGGSDLANRQRAACREREARDRADDLREFAPIVVCA